MILSGKAKLAGVLGWPVGHSLSPRLHGWWLDQYGIDGAYVPMAVRPEDVADSLRALAKLGFRGVNVTLPHKQAALACVDEADELARRIGAVNTVTITDQGRLVGSNTDGFGFIENLQQGAPDWQATSGPVTVLGAGGAARAICAALLDAGVPEIRLVNRTRSRAEKLAADLGGPIAPLPWDAWEDALAGATLLANTTQLGMNGQPPLVLDLAALPAAAVVNDAVYAPLQTPLLAAAAARGNPVVGGLGMLIHQARPGFAAWFGREPEVSAALFAFLTAEIAP